MYVLCSQINIRTGNHPNKYKCEHVCTHVGFCHRCKYDSKFCVIQGRSDWTPPSLVKFGVNFLPKSLSLVQVLSFMSTLRSDQICCILLLADSQTTRAVFIGVQTMTLHKTTIWGGQQNSMHFYNNKVITATPV